VSLPVSYAFSVVFRGPSGLFKIGYPQAFKNDRGKLFLLIYVRFENSSNWLESELEWINADSCTCLEIIDIYTLQELMSRDEITLKHLECIKSFKTKYTEEVS
jgi:hypothetical protein